MKPIVKDSSPAPAKAAVKGPAPAPAKAVVKGPPPAPAKAVVKGPAPAPAKAAVKGPSPAPAKAAMNGVNNVDVAKEAAAKAAAEQAAKVAAAKAAEEKAAKEAAARKALTWPKATMTDHNVVETYVKKVYNIWRGLKSNSKKENIIREVCRSLDEVHQMCGIPKTQLDIYYSVPGDCGQFNQYYWQMSVNANILSSSNITKPEFYLLAETLYHEGRHAEQVWLISVHSLFEKRVWSATHKKYEIPNLVRAKYDTPVPDIFFDKALGVALNRGKAPEKEAGKIYDDYTAFIKKVKQWDESFIKNGAKTTIICNNAGKSAHWRHKYQTLPHEYDAFLIEEKLRDEFKKITDFRDTAIQATPGPCEHCHGKNNQHVFSGLPLDKVK